MYALLPDDMQMRTPNRGSTLLGRADIYVIEVSVAGLTWWNGKPEAIRRIAGVGRAR
ncbi:hypothetical protein [Williamsia soli]|uniref:hypothetical protein n=1 Tax=Williamsia soli TaxID=364929 RepID=UPI001A9DA68F|nr:hypothetical protein [Williamsia soli]